MSALFVELTILPGILRLRGCGHRRQSSQHRMPSNLHEDAHGVGGKAGVNHLKLQPLLRGAGIPITAIEVLIPRGLSLLRGIRVISADLSGPDEVRDLPQGLGQHHLVLFHQGELEAAALKVI